MKRFASIRFHSSIIVSCSLIVPLFAIYMILAYLACVRHYRCFLYEEKTHHQGKVVYLLAQSGEPTCNGLTTVSEGSPTIKLTKGKKLGSFQFYYKQFLLTIMFISNFSFHPSYLFFFCARQQSTKSITSVNILRGLLNIMTGILWTVLRFITLQTKMLRSKYGYKTSMEIRFTTRKLCVIIWRSYIPPTIRKDTKYS